MHALFLFCLGCLRTVVICKTHGFFVFIKTIQIVIFIPHSTFVSRKDSTDSKKLHSRKLSLDGRRDRSAHASLVIKNAEKIDDIFRAKNIRCLCITLLLQ